MTTSPYVRGYADAYLSSVFEPPVLQGVDAVEAYVNGQADGHCDAVSPDRPGNPILAFVLDTTAAAGGIPVRQPPDNRGFGFRAPRARYGQRRHSGFTLRRG